MRSTIIGVLFVALVALGVRYRIDVKSESEPVGSTSVVRGVALGLFASDSEWDYGPMVDEIRARGATDVLVVVNAYQSDRFASDISTKPGRSPSEATIVRTLSQARAAGLRTALMPVVRLESRTKYEWRGVIAPADGLDVWFDSYRAWVLPLAEIAHEEQVQRFVVGSELGSLEHYDGRWRELIAEVRSRFEGTVTYSANWDRAGEVPFWDAVDEVGLTAYFPVGDALSPDDLARAWESPSAAIEELAVRTKRPVLVTEVGYASRRHSGERPWDDASDAEVDLEGQRRLYRGFCDAFARTSSLSGFYVWNWFGVGGPRDRGYTPRGKPAASELSKCFVREWPARSVSGSRS
jgi:hypothetical protein